MTGSGTGPQSVVDELLSDPPVVHIVDTPTGKVPGVWAADESCYRFIARTVRPGMSTLETGSGISTALFASLGAHHRCVTPAAEEADHLRRYFGRTGIDADNVIFDIAPSHVALPRLHDRFDIVFIDGAHGFPLPIIDWFYACGLLATGGTLIVDDLQLPGVRVLLEFLNQDPRWEVIEQTRKWGAFRRLGAGDMLEGQWEQPFFFPRCMRPAFPLRVINRLRRELAGR